MARLQIIRYQSAKFSESNWKLKESDSSVIIINLDNEVGKGRKNQNRFEMVLKGMNSIE